MIIYHCTECGYYFADRQGMKRIGLHGQQTRVEEIVCAACKKKAKQ